MATSSSSSRSRPRSGLAAIGRLVASRVLSGKVTGAELKESLCLDQVLEPVLAEVIELEVGVEQHPRRLGEHDLTAVRGSGNAGRAVNVDPHIAFVGHDRLAGVDADAHLHRP